MGASDTPVRFGRLTLRGRRADVSAARGPLLDAIDRAPWPLTAPQEIILVRRIHVRAPVHQVARLAAQHALEQVQQAVDGWSVGAGAADCVRFRSTGDMHACLIHDLLSGRVGERWFWQRRRPDPGLNPAQAITRVVLSSPLELPELFARLESMPVWSRLWLALDDESCSRILHGVSAATGWALARTPGADAARREDQAGEAYPLSRVAARDFLAALPPDSFPDTGPRSRLAALVLAWRHWPALLEHDAPGLLASLVRQLAFDRALRSGRAVAPGAPASSVAEPPRPAIPGGSSHRPHAAESTIESPLPQTPAADALPPARTLTVLPLKEPPAEPVPPGVSVPRDAGAPAPADPGQAVAPWAIRSGQAVTGEDGESFSSGVGGLFYLLNVLRLPEFQARLRADADPGAGWRWLIRTGLHMGLAPEGALAAFLGREAQLEVGPLSSLGALPGELWAVAMRRYGLVLTQTELFTIPARIQYTQSHVDVHLRMADVNLEIRRRGLDVNPGWLPWLGRVVSFHFGSPLEPPAPRP